VPGGTWFPRGCVAGKSEPECARARDRRLPLGQRSDPLATNVAARGLDVPEAGQVINYELPELPEGFTHRVGRTGRMGRAGRAITLLAPDEAAKWRRFERTLSRKLHRQPWVQPGKARVGAATARATSAVRCACP
jgi:superfamily II DNA/RNA helicase